MMTLFWAVLALIGLALLFGVLLGFASIKFKVEADPIVDQLDAILPQSQCGQCGYPGCRPYAEAVSNGEQINKCAPGGEAVVLKIADLLGVEPPAADANAENAEPRKFVAFIHEEQCIGCTKCIQACPVDAIIGSTKSVHTVISDLCTGCDLCVAPCPTDCIEMQPVSVTPDTWKWDLNTIPVKVVS
ncbi:MULTISPECIES: electron transport complex subunit RsxB [Plesiomonas]|uniref:Ion-translocating oxidoreductase complex subunit B n=2 Tax=Plesiomonas shigelloides TaxID=703 RepID=R8AVX3_PLESH|nr:MULTISPECIES: electron transport complex subunit RsxB [Plesiomonas]MDO4688800.1 electron transport complex subunit RsxB [Plesiomonas sp.]AVQ86572.1 electron transport complex subunit RsxB [Plesiomonas shigelloides]EON90473.1 electron transport complex protein RnfB [Plesiomonas shigelloides 302-73]KAB7658076.1 electron transport complex subunit RsxB [Plesiomonas shigelloides]KAB7666023.1 electron transport complex subunit RsxB [Plesiomonas shigelloides]